MPAWSALALPLAILAAWLWREWRHERERRELLNRIARPGLILDHGPPRKRSGRNRRWSDRRMAELERGRHGV